MKKFTKICLIPAAIFFAIGLPMLIICGLLGGFNYVNDNSKDILMKNSLVTRFAPLSAIDKESRENVLSESIEGINQGDLESMEIVPSSDEHFKLAEADDKITNVIFMTGLGETNIKYSDDDCYYIKNKMQKSSVKYSVEDGCLVIYVEHPNVVFSENESLDIFIPRDAQLENYVLHEAAGQLESVDVKAENCKITLEAGTVDIAGADCENLTIDVGEGEVILKDFYAKNIDADIDMGSLELKGTVKEGGSIDANCDMGSIDMFLDNDESEFNYDTRCTMGDITLNGKSSEGMNASISSAGSKDADKSLKLECNMGSINVGFSKEL